MTSETTSETTSDTLSEQTQAFLGALRREHTDFTGVVRYGSYDDVRRSLENHGPLAREALLLRALRVGSEEALWDYDHPDHYRRHICGLCGLPIPPSAYTVRHLMTNQRFCVKCGLNGSRRSARYAAVAAVAAHQAESLTRLAQIEDDYDATYGMGSALVSRARAQYWGRVAQWYGAYGRRITECESRDRALYTPHNEVRYSNLLAPIAPLNAHDAWTLLGLAEQGRAQREHDMEAHGWLDGHPHPDEPNWVGFAQSYATWQQVEAQYKRRYTALSTREQAARVIVAAQRHL